MNRTTLFAACAGIVLAASAAQAQIVVTSSPVVTYPPTPVVNTYYAPSYYAPSAPVVTYDVPAFAAAPVTTYYAPAPATVPVTTFYGPTTTYYGGTVVAPVVGGPVAVGSSAYGTLRPYVIGQPVRNTVRYFAP